MSKQPSAALLSESLQNLSISPSGTAATPKATSKKAAAAAVADSWEDESSSSDTEATPSNVPSRQLPTIITTATDNPRAPPPTPSSPRSPNFSSSSLRSFPNMDTIAFDTPMGPGSSSSAPRTTAAGAQEKRPEKSTAVASRLISAGLGIRAPKRTEEQREYDKSVRAQERRKKEREIEERNRAKAQADKARAAVWGD